MLILAPLDCFEKPRMIADVHSVEQRTIRQPKGFLSLRIPRGRIAEYRPDVGEVSGSDDENVSSLAQPAQRVECPLKVVL